MFGLGIWEVVLILVTALLVLGPEKMPQAARQVARFIGELKRVSDDVRRNFDDVLAEPTDIVGVAMPRIPPAGVQAVEKSAGIQASATGGPKSTEASSAVTAAETGTMAGAADTAATLAVTAPVTASQESPAAATPKTLATAPIKDHPA